MAQEKTPSPPEDGAAPPEGAATPGAEVRSANSSAGDEGASASPGAPSETSSPEAGATTGGADAPEQETLFWRLAPWLIAAGFLLELFLFGFRAELDVCVAKTGAHDFKLMGQERTDANRWRYPTCERRINLGFRGHYTELVQDGREAACRRATVLRYKQEARDCAAGRQHWEVQVASKQVWPWERRFYRALIGLD